MVLVQNNRILISLKANEDSQSSDEWIGFIQTIKKIMKTSSMKMVDEVANQSDKVKSEIKAQTEKINSQITAQSEKFETLKQEFTSHQQSLKEI